MTAEEKRLRALLAEALEGYGLAMFYVPKSETGLADRHERLLKVLERSEASKRGKSNRAVGHESEVMVANYLRDQHGFTDAATTRKVLGHDGSRQPGDVSFAPGVCLSVKYTKGAPSWPAWLREVIQEAGENRLPVVVQRSKGNRNVGSWPCVTPRGWYQANVIGGLESLQVVMRGDFEKYLNGDRFRAAMDDQFAVMRFRTFAETVRLDR